MFEKKELNHARELIDALVQIEPKQPGKWAEVTFTQKLDRLSELIDALRFAAGCPAGDPQKTFRPNHVTADPDGGTLHFTESPRGPTVQPWTPEHLMLPLLVYLYEKPPRGRRVLSILRDFVRHHLPRCRMVDFERTATGVLRIETNTRFAARLLRQRGFLQYTIEEAFKTWRLSLLGILVGDQLSYDEGLLQKRDANLLFLGKVLEQLEPLKTLPHLIAKLERISRGSSIPWHEKKVFLQKTMEAIAQYRDIVRRDDDLSESRRNQEVTDVLHDLNRAPEAQALVSAFDQDPSCQIKLL